MAKAKSRTLTLGLLLFLAFNALALNAFLSLVSPEPYKETVLQHTRDVLLGHGGDDSWGAMHVALEQVNTAPSVPLYTEVFFNRQYRFQYPPSALFALSGLRLIDPARVQVDDFYAGPWPALNTLFGWFFIALAAGATAALLEIRLRQEHPKCDWTHLVPVRGLLVAGLALTFYPLVKGFSLGQIQVWINGAFAVALLAWVMRWRTFSGVLVGAMSLIKPHYGLMVVWALLRGEIRFASACGATISLGVAVSIARFGWANSIDYLSVLSFLSQHGEAFYPNQSVNGLLNRLMGTFDPVNYVSLDLPPGKFPPFTPWIYALTLVTSAAILLSGFLHRSAPSDPPRLLDFAAMALSCTMASPIAWEHHYGILLPIYAVALAHALDSRARLAWLGISYVLVSTFIAAANMLAATPLNVLQSTGLAGAVIILVLLHGRRPTGSRQLA
ncbi:MAG: glycosyltransferase family 87 protein [Hyphomicrobiaceae bacterium]